MPKLSRFFIRAALVYLLLGFSFGALILANKGIPFAPLVWALFPSHIEFLTLGWLTQLALGVAFWILPRLGRDAPRGDERWSWAAFVLVNLGILISAASPYAGLPWLGMTARIIQFGGFGLFVIGNWQRIYPPKWPARTKQESASESDIEV
ncbi:MAG: cbb3-type cytochrome c oxidase subunit I [Anaerolineae bacterium]|nr:cbb3-type cytochrome c oxidase subunit I [Anaerolineae bacterium]